jgi:hypothetical protein
MKGEAYWTGGDYDPMTTQNKLDIALKALREIEEYAVKHECFVSAVPKSHMVKVFKIAKEALERMEETQ